MRPLGLSLMIAGLFLVVYGILFVPAGFYIFGQMPWIYIIASGTLLFVILFLLIYFSVEKFIYKKIKLIYKTIHSQKVNKKGEFHPRIPAEKMMADAETEVLKWAENQAIETERQKKLEEYRKDFIGNLSHELKTPIFNIQGYLLTLIDGGLEDVKINREYLLRAEKSVNRMISIVSDLDLIYKIESDIMKLKSEKTDIVSLVQEVLDFYEMTASQANIALSISQGPMMPLYVFADREQIRVVLNNLVENSLKYGSPGGKTTVKFFDMGDHILTEITDDGMGISKEELSRIFERFYRTASGRSREQSGSGLGLSIVKHIIDAHQQTINVRSTPGVGTTFAFTLPKKMPPK